MPGGIVEVCGSTPRHQKIARPSDDISIILCYFVTVVIVLIIINVATTKYGRRSHLPGWTL